MLHLRIVSPEKVVFDGKVDSVLVPGTLGSFEILKDHAPIISSLEKGVVEYQSHQQRQTIVILGGFVEVKQNDVSLCVEV
jgi:hypothetical protein